MDPTENNRKREVITAFAVLLAIVIIVGGVVAASKKSSDSAATVASADSQTSQTSTSTSSQTTTYKDGSYTSSASYNSPGGQESVTVKLTLTNNTVTDSTVTGGATDREAREYQSQFISAYKQYVNGKSLNDIKLSRVSGSSLTSIGFNKALEQIKQQAS